MPFNSQQFMDVFTRYNETVFPMQIILFVAALIAVYLAKNGDNRSSKGAALILAFLWLWMGAVYHWIFFYEINGLAFTFGVFFVVQSGLLIYAGAIRSDLSFRAGSDRRSFIGTLMIGYALVIYPLIGIAAGHVYPNSPTFGLPCPTTIFTFGLLLQSTRPTPVYVLPIPFLWSMLGVSAAFLFGVWEDLGLPIAASVATTVMVIDNIRRRPRGTTHLILKEN